MAFSGKEIRFKIFYKNSLAKELQQLDRKRNKIKDVLLPLGISSCMLFVFEILGEYPFALYDNSYVSYSIALLAFIISKYYVFYSRKNVPRLKKSYKIQIIEKIVHHIDPSLTYKVYQERSADETLEINKSCLFNEIVTYTHIDDLVTGEVNKINIRFFTLNTGCIRDGNSKTTTVFQGLFFMVRFNIEFCGKIIVLPGRAEKILGSLERKMQLVSLSLVKNKEGLQPVVADDPEFEKEYMVYSNDQTTAQKLLEPPLMKAIMQFRLKFDKRIFFSFINTSRYSTTMYIAIPYKKRLFEPSIILKLENYKQIEEYYLILRNCLDLVKSLPLEKLMLKTSLVH